MKIMNRKGVFYTFMTLLLILSILAMQTVSRTQQKGIQENSIFNDAFVIVNNRFNNILLDMVIIDKKGSAKEIQERILPFSSFIDRNSITFNSELPINPGTIEYYFNSINAYDIFVSDRNYPNIYDGLAVDVNTIQSGDWGGAANKLNFYIFPNCLNYFAEDLNRIGFEAAYCGRSFDINSIERYDVNVNIRPGLGEDYNAVTCNIQGFAGCPNLPFDALNPFPYFELWINDENCSYCSINPSLKNIRGHYNPSADNNIIISCNPSAGSCNSSPIEIDLGQGPIAMHTGTVIDVVMRAEFVEKIYYLYFPDFNFSVENEIFAIGRRNN